MFKDHFSGHAGDYAESRPRYPEALFEHLAGIAPAKRRAWDCATGNGQAALALAGHFTRVVASDASFEQLSHAFGHPRVGYVRSRAEASGITGRSVDLVTVAQAIHWFDLPRFFSETNRVLADGGVVAFWTYNLLRAGDAVDPLIDGLYFDTLGPYWPPERRLVDEGYAGLTMPFAELSLPAFRMTADWDLEALLRYLKTWSSVPRFRAARGWDPIEDARTSFASAWGNPATKREIVWPLTVRAGTRAG